MGNKSEIFLHKNYCHLILVKFVRHLTWPVSNHLVIANYQLGTGIYQANWHSP